MSAGGHMRPALPPAIHACLLDLDGVLTDTATIHSAAWKQMFDEYLSQHAGRGGEFVPFDRATDYRDYVDGKPRAEGVRAFLASRGIEPDDATVHKLGSQKNEIVLRLIAERGVRPYPGSVRYLEAARDAGLRLAVVSSSTNCKEVLEAAGLEDFFDARIDGLVAEREGLAGKPAPDTYLAGARALSVEPQEAAVFEDALAGVEAGHAGGFGSVIGVDRNDDREALREHGATAVVRDLGDLLEAQ
jgi:beta-phosphoglucomutase family hydrolase